MITSRYHVQNVSLLWRRAVEPVDIDELGVVPDSGHTHMKVPWTEFDVDGYLRPTLLSPDEDPFQRYQYNQTASDLIRVDRDIPDTRHERFDSYFIINWVGRGGAGRGGVVM